MLDSPFVRCPTSQASQDLLPQLHPGLFTRKKARGGRDRGRGGGSFDLLPKERGEANFSPVKLLAYQLTLVKEKNIPSTICSQSEAGVGPGASCSSGSQTQFQNPRQLPPGLFREAAQLRGTPAFEAFPVTPKLFATSPRLPAPSRALEAFQLSPQWLSCFQLLLQLQRGSDFLSWRSEGGEGGGIPSPPSQPPLRELLPPPPPKPGDPPATQASTQSQSFSLLQSLLKGAPPLVGEKLRGWDEGSQAGMTASEGPWGFQGQQFGRKGVGQEMEPGQQEGTKPAAPGGPGASGRGRD